MNIFIKHCNGQNGHFTRFWHQNVVSRIYAHLSVIRQQMSAFCPFRGGVAESGQCLLFLPFFLDESFPYLSSPGSFLDRHCFPCRIPLQTTQGERKIITSELKSFNLNMVHICIWNMFLAGVFPHKDLPPKHWREGPGTCKAIIICCVPWFRF